MWHTGQRTQYWVAAQGFDTILDALALSPNDTQIKQLVYDFYESQDKIGQYSTVCTVWGERKKSGAVSFFDAWNQRGSPLHVDCLWCHNDDTSGWSRDYYDDENWMAMALVRAYEATKDTRFLNRATSLWKDIADAWDTTCCGSVKGEATDVL